MGPAETWAVLRAARRVDILAGLGWIALAYGLRGGRWLVWERTLGYADAAGLVLIGFMGNNLLPARQGELLRARCTAHRTHLGGTAALASVAAERILDALAIAVCGVAAAATLPVSQAVRAGLLAASFAVALPAAALLASLFGQARVRRLLAAVHLRFPGHLTRYARARAEHFLDGLAVLQGARRLAVAALLTAALWAAEAGAFAAFARAARLPLAPNEVLAFMAVVNLASLFPLVPGGIGVGEGAATALLAALGVAAPSGLAAALLQHGVQYAFTTGAGAALYLGGGFPGTPLPRAEGAARRREAQEAAAGPEALAGTRVGLGALAAAGSLQPPDQREVELSIVIPAYDEQSRLPRTLLETLGWCSRQRIDAEILVADDGSRDQTLTLARLFEGQDRRVRVLACPHMGKGAAVRMGVLNARGRRVLFMDADGATPLDEMPKLLGALDGGADVAIGSRVVQQPGEIRVETSLHRRVIGRTFALLVNLLAVPGIADTQCGFKVFRREVVPALFARQRTSGFAFDVEILYLAHRLGLRVVEIPVNWVSQPGSKVNLVTDSLRMLWDVARLRGLHRRVDRLAGLHDRADLDGPSGGPAIG